MSRFAMFSQNIGADEFGRYEKSGKTQETTRFVSFLNNTGTKIS